MLLDHHHSHHQSSHFHEQDIHAALIVTNGNQLVVTDLTVDDEVTDGVQLGGATVLMSNLRVDKGEEAAMILQGEAVLAILYFKWPVCSWQAFLHPACVLVER